MLKSSFLTLLSLSTTSELHIHLKHIITSDSFMILQMHSSIIFLIHSLMAELHFISSLLSFLPRKLCSASLSSQQYWTTVSTSYYLSHNIISPYTVLGDSLGHHFPNHNNRLTDEKFWLVLFLPALGLHPLGSITFTLFIFSCRPYRTGYRRRYALEYDI